MTIDAASAAPRLRRSLTLWNLVIIGIVMIQPIAPMGIYGVVHNAARGHVVTTILIAMVAMLLTAISYGMLARVYPSAGSAYTYVGQELHVGLGYLTGWAIVMDYLLNPLICIVLCSKLTQNILAGSSLLGSGNFLCGGIYAFESARSENFGANQRNSGERDDDCGHRVFCLRDPIFDSASQFRTAFFHQALLRPIHFQFRTDFSRNLDRGSDLYRVRRDFHIF